MNIDKKIISYILLLFLTVSNVVNPLASVIDATPRVSTKNEIESDTPNQSFSGQLTGQEILDDIEKQNNKKEENTTDLDVNKKVNSTKSEYNADEEFVKQLEKEGLTLDIDNLDKNIEHIEEDGIYDVDETIQEKEIFKDNKNTPSARAVTDNALDFYNKYQAQTGQMLFVEGAYYYCTRYKEAASTSTTAYRTLGYQVTLERENKVFYDRVMIGGVVKRIHEVAKSESGGTYLYALYRMNIYDDDDTTQSLLSRLKSRHKYNDIVENTIMPGQTTTFEFNPIYTIVVNDSVKGSLNSYGNVSGEIYLTPKGSTAIAVPSGWELVYPTGYSWSLYTTYDTDKGGIAGARGWSASAQTNLVNAFNMRASISGASIPVTRYITVKHINADTGATIASDTSAVTVLSYTANTNIVTRTYGDLEFKNATFSHAGLSSPQTITTTPVTVSVPKDQSNQYLNIYYRAKVRDEKVTIKHHIYGSSTKIYPDEVITVRNVPYAGLNYTFSPKTFNEYTNNYKEHWVNGSIIKTASGNGNFTPTVRYGAGSQDVIFYYQMDSVPSDTQGKGSITFSPSYTNWVNSNISIKLTVDGNTSITKYATKNRQLYYSGQTLTVPSIVKEVWVIDNLYVWGNGKNISNAGVSYGTATPANGGTFTISQEAKEGELGAKVNNWRLSSTSWLNSYSVSTSAAPANSTSKPTYTYESYSKAQSGGATYNLDKTKPTLSISKNNSAWTNQDISLTLSGSDNLSGIKFSDNNVTNITIKDESILGKSDVTQLFNKASIDIKLSNDGIWKIYANATDLAGNKQSLTTGQYKLDKTKPTASVDKSKVDWINQDITVKVTHSDNLSGVKSASTTYTDSSHYNRNSVTTTTISPTIKFTQDGIYNISTSYTDNANNTNSSSWGQYKLDKTKPTATIDKSSVSWTNQDITIKVTHSDNLSGVKNATTSYTDSSYYNRGTTTSTSITPTMTISKDGIYDVSTSYTDNAGNTNSNSWGKHKLDKTKPNVATFTEDNRTYIDDDLTITVTVGDNLSGLQEVKYVVNNSATSTAGTQVDTRVTTSENTTETKTFDVNLTNSGSYYIHVYTKDRAGNELWTTSKNFKIIKFDTSDTYLYPRAKGVRGTRFDIIANIKGALNSDITSGNVKVNINDLPNWFLDDVNKKTNGNFAVTSGTQKRTLKLYSALSTGNQSVSDSSSITTVYDSTVIPFGTPCTIDRNGNRIKAQQKITLQLEIKSSFYKVTQSRPITLTFDIVPEVELKTEIINNQY